MKVLNKRDNYKHEKYSRRFTVGSLYVVTSELYLCSILDLDKNYHRKVLQFGPKSKIQKDSVLFCIKERIIPDRRLRAKSKCNIYEVVFLCNESLVVFYSFPDSTNLDSSLIKLASPLI